MYFFPWRHASASPEHYSSSAGPLARWWERLYAMVYGLGVLGALWPAFPVWSAALFL